MNLDPILEKVSWDDVLRARESMAGNRYIRFIRYGNNELDLSDRKKVNSNDLQQIRENYPEWADWFLYYSARAVPDLGQWEKLGLANDIRSDRFLYEFVRYVPDLAPEQRFGLIGKIKKGYYRYRSIRDSPGLAPEQRFVLSGHIQDDECLYLLVRDIEELTPTQKHILTDKIEDAHYRRLAFLCLAEETEET